MFCEEKDCDLIDYFLWIESFVCLGIFGCYDFGCQIYRCGVLFDFF